MKNNEYDHKAVESHWRAVWEKTGIYDTDIAGAKNPFDKTQGKPYYNLMMFPYPSAEGLHVGNMYAFTGSDVFGRYKRMKGYNVFEPIGLDGFGIHSENFALKIGRHPMDHAVITEKNFYNQLHKIGAMFDWSRTVETYDPGYYKWTQWLFVQMFKHGLAYRKMASVNWCPSDKTVLADEQVIDGRCERCGNLVSNKLLEQWFFRITAYAEKLLENSFKLDWSEKVKIAQQNWIGKKEGINITYKVVDRAGQTFDEDIVCFTTTPVNFAATFIAIAPEHPFINKIARVIDSKQADLITKYIKSPKTKAKTGIFSGFYAVNHLTGDKLPIWISDFVIMDVGTGAIQGCPGHDLRDFEFAIKFNLPIKRVVVGPDGDTSPIATAIQVIEHGPGKMINSGFLDGMEFGKAMQKTMDYFEAKGWGKRVTNYHLRDWLISRQRYWGPPIPMIFCKKCAKEGRGWFNSSEAKKESTADASSNLGVLRSSAGASAPSAKNSNLPKRPASSIGNSALWAAGWYPVPEGELPVILPRIEDYKPGDDGVAPLAKHKEFYETTCPGCEGKAVRETDVSDTFLDSSWYFLRYPSVNIKGASLGEASFAYPSNPVSSRLAGSIDETRIKSEVADAKDVTVLESAHLAAPLQQLPWNSIITKKWLPVDMYTGGAEHSVLHLMYSRFITMALHDWGYIDFEEPFDKFFAHGLVIKDGAKMSKSKGNVVNPDQYIDSYGADSLRLYLMFMGPYGEGGDFRDTAMEGMYRWIGRIWRMISRQYNLKEHDKQIYESSDKVRIALGKLIKKVSEDLEKRRYNTAIASMMEFTNLVGNENGALGLSDAKIFIKLLAPFAPFITEELWQKLNGGGVLGSSIHKEPWPRFDESVLVEQSVTIVVEVNAKVRGQISILREEAKSEESVTKIAKSEPKVKNFLTGKTIQKTIFVPGKLINFVVS